MSITQLYQRCTLRPGESLVSLVSRMAMRNGFDAADNFCTPMRIAFNIWGFGEPFAIEAISKSTGVPPSDLRAMTFRHDHDAYYYGHERITKRMVREYEIYACPGCLRFDRRGKRAKWDQGFYGRTEWLLSVFRSCPIHGVALVPVAIASGGNPNERHDFARLLRRQAPVIRKLISEARNRHPSRLEEYVRRRLSGSEREAEWLDQMDLYAAIQTCEMLGLLLNVGPSARPVEMEDKEWHRAGDVGYQFACNGYEGIGYALSEAQGKAHSRQPGRHDPVAVFGFFYDWLTQVASDSAFDLLRARFQDHVDQTMPASATTVSGQPVGPNGQRSVDKAANENRPSLLEFDQSDEL